MRLSPVSALPPRLRILALTYSLHHPRLRGSARHYYLIRELGRHHAITLLALTDGPVPEEVLRDLAAYTDRVETFEIPGRHFVSDGRGRSRRSLASRIGKIRRGRSAVRAMRLEVHRLLEGGGYDLVLLHGNRLLRALDGHRDVPLVADICDANSMRLAGRMKYIGARGRPAAYLRYRLTRRLERRVAGATLHLAFISARDRAAVLGAGSEAAVIPNGVDLDYWRRSGRASRPGSRLVFTGVMSYGPNEDAALHLIDDVLPLVRASVPDVEVLIVGRDPPPALLERARRLPEVTVTGFVDDLRPYLEQAALFVAPIRFASGMQNKIQEALAMEVPVVTTPIVAAGLTLDGEEPPLAVAEGARALADRVVELLGADAERARLAEDGRRFAEKRFVWADSAAKLERLCLAAVGTSGRGRAGTRFE